MRPEAEWAIDSEPIRARRIIVKKPARVDQIRRCLPTAEGRQSWRKWRKISQIIVAFC